MRDLLKHYADRGGTVLLSSHLLNEVELIADEMVVIGNGRIVAQGDKKSLLAMDSNVSALVTSLDNDALAAQLRQQGFTVAPEGEGLRVGCSPEEIGRAALAAGVVLTDLRTGAAGLEDLFLELTAANQRDDLTEGATA